MERLLPLRRSDASSWKLRRWGWLLCGLATGCFSQLGRRTGAIREQYFRHLVGLSELKRRFDMLRQFSPELSGDLDRSSGLVVVSYLSSPADCVLDPSGSTDGVVKVPCSISYPAHPYWDGYL